MSMTDKEVDSLIESLAQCSNAVVVKFDINPMDSASAINTYIDKHQINSSEIIGIKVATRIDGMITAVMVWGRREKIGILGLKGDKGNKGDTGKQGLPGKDGNCLPPA